MNTLLEEPDLVAEGRRNQACRRLAEFLVLCGQRRGDGLWTEAFEFWKENPQTDQPALPDLVEARRFAEALRQQLGGCAAATRIGVRQSNNIVRVRVIADCEAQPADAVERAWAVAA